MSWFAVIIMPLLVFIATWWLTGRVLGWLRRRAILDRPVDRSAHSIPVPRGGGIAVISVLAVAWLALALLGCAPVGTESISGLAVALAVLSWLDDLRGLPIGLRFLVHALAVAAGLAFLPIGMVFQGLLPPVLDRFAAALLWLWFVNLFNFMDGIDGITGIETATIGLGVALVSAIGGTVDSGWGALALCAAAGGLAFLRWNWHPAKLFLGDVGSVPLGYLLGWLLLGLAAQGTWAPALIVPLYYLADATLTLARRVLRGERFWRAHRQHFYQRALGGDGNHAAVAGIILAGNVLLLALAFLTPTRPLAALVLAALVVAGLLTALELRSRRVTTRTAD